MIAPTSSREPSTPSPIIDVNFPRLLTVADIMRALQIGERQAYAVANAAGHVKLGRSIRVRPEDLAAYLVTLTQRGAA